MDSISERKEMRQEMADQELQNWISPLANFTFKTILIPLSLPEAESCIKFYQIYILRHKKQLTETDITHIRLLTTRIQDSITHLLQTEKDKCFIRLSTRSPKDAILGRFIPSEYFPHAIDKHTQLKDELAEALLEIYEDSGVPNVIFEYESNPPPTEIDYNHEYRILMSIATRLLSVFSAEDALNLFLHSERVNVDLNMAVLYPESYDMQIVLRKWSDVLEYWNEFRVFIYDSNVVAISQYDCYVYFEELQSGQVLNDIRSRIVSFYNTYIQVCYIYFSGLLVVCRKK